MVGSDLSVPSGGIVDGEDQVHHWPGGYDTVGVLVQSRLLKYCRSISESIVNLREVTKDILHRITNR